MDKTVVKAGGDGLREVTIQLLQEDIAETDERMHGGMRAAGDATVGYLRGNSPRDTGEYAGSWGQNVDETEYGHVSVEVGNTIGQLTHLLTDGHDIYTSRGGPYGHVGPADPQGYIDEAFERGKQAIRDHTGIEV